MTTTTVLRKEDALIIIDFLSGGALGVPRVMHTSGAAFAASLDLSRPPIVSKDPISRHEVYSAFADTTREAWLRQTGVQRVFIGTFGIEFCVLHPARDAAVALRALNRAADFPVVQPQARLMALFPTAAAAGARFDAVIDHGGFAARMYADSASETGDERESGDHVSL